MTYTYYSLCCSNVQTNVQTNLYLTRLTAVWNQVVGNAGHAMIMQLGEVSISSAMLLFACWGGGEASKKDG